jgi:RimJ/RimL family protein N-acetyltransferase
MATDSRPTDTLRTRNLLLDAVTGADTQRVFEYCQDTELQGFVPVPVPYTMESATGYTQAYAVDARWLWAIRDRVDGPLLGVIELSPKELASAELGYWLGSEHRGRGIMTEAAIAVVEYAFTVAGLEHVQWCAVVGNVPSAIVARNAGLRYEGLRRMSMPHRGMRLDGWFGSILRTDDRIPQGGWPL